MKNIIVRIVVLIVVFLATVFLVNKWDNAGMDAIGVYGSGRG